MFKSCIESLSTWLRGYFDKYSDEQRKVWCGEDVEPAPYKLEPKKKTTKRKTKTKTKRKRRKKKE